VSRQSARGRESSGQGEMRKPRLSGCGLLHGSVSPVLLFLLLVMLEASWRAAAQAQPAPQTDPVEGMFVLYLLARQSSAL
jgi:hypothetical protein